MCGMLAGLCYCITHPIETVKTRVQVQPDNVKRQGFIRTFAHIARTEGFILLAYDYFVINIFINIINRILIFAINNNSK